MLKNKEVILWKMLFVRLSTMLLLLSFSRWLLYIFSTNNFNDLNLNELFRLYFLGFRFDIYTLIIFNIPLIFFYCIPSKIKYNHIYKKIIDILFVIGNSAAIALNLIDVIYYRYLDKRMSSELFTFFKGSDENRGSLIFNFIIDFWYMFLIFFVILFIIGGFQLKPINLTTATDYTSPKNIPLIINTPFENTVTYVDNGKLSTQNLNLNCSNIITE